MKVAVFGGSGFVGEYIINELLNSNFKPYILLRYGSQSKVTRNKECKVITGDIDNKTAIEQTIMNVEAVIYNIGIIREFKSHDITFEKLHYEGLINCIEQAKKLNVKRFILMSANGVKKEGTEYQKTKFKAETYLKESGLDWTIFRPSLIFGDPNGKIEFCTQLKKDMLSLPFPAPLFYNDFFPFNPGNFKMSPIQVGDVAKVFVKALTKEETIHQTYKLGGENFTWKEIIKMISIASGNEEKLFIPVPVFSVKIIAKLFDRFSWFPISEEQIVMLVEGNICDSTKNFELFGIKKPKEFNLESLEYLKDA